jgi:hypothetical protein
MIGKHCPIFAVNREVLFLLFNFLIKIFEFKLKVLWVLFFWKSNGLFYFIFIGVDSYSKTNWLYRLWSL